MRVPDVAKCLFYQADFNAAKLHVSFTISAEKYSSVRSLLIIYLAVKVNMV